VLSSGDRLTTQQKHKSCSSSGPRKVGPIVSSYSLTSQLRISVILTDHSGLLAGLWEFPAVDLPTENTSTNSSRSRASADLVSSLFESPSRLVFESAAHPHRRSSSPSIRVAESAHLGAVDHVFSHQKRRYHVQRVVLRSATLPPLSSGISRARWIEEGKVVEANVGNVVKKIWALVEGMQNEGEESDRPIVKSKRRRKI